MSKVRLYGDTSGFVDLKAPDVASNVTITLPNTTGPFATEAYADAAAASAGGLVAVHSVTKTDAFTVSAIARTAHNVTGLALNNIALSDASNKLVVMVQMGSVATSIDNCDVALRLRVNGAFDILTGASSDNRFLITTGGRNSGGGNLAVTTPSIMGVYAPGSTSARNYQVQVYNTDTTTTTLYVNRTESDANTTTGRTASTFTLMEVRV